MPTNGFSIKPLKVKLLAGEQKSNRDLAFGWIVFSKIQAMNLMNPDECQIFARHYAFHEAGGDRSPPVVVGEGPLQHWFGLNM